MAAIGATLQQRYVIEQELGRGGFGAVYKATDKRLNKAVALKETFHVQPQMIEMFRREAEVLAGLDHPNLPAVTDYFTEGGSYYLVMAYVPGIDLEYHVRGRRLSEAEALRIMAPVLDALEYMHRRNPPIIHRDIKPGNIRLTPEGRVFLVDFGLAKSYYTNIVSKSSVIAATPGFAPPEQYSGLASPRTDLYAIGATLYVLLTGDMPADAFSRLNGAPLVPPRQLSQQVSPHVERAVNRALELKPENRYPDVASLRRELVQPAPTTQRVRPLPPARSPMAWVPWVISGALVVMLVGVLLAVGLGGGGLGAEEPTPTTPAVAVEEPTNTPEPPTATPEPPTATPEPTPLPTSLTTEVAPGITMDFVLVPAGPFLMGSSDEDPDAEDDEKPQHELTLPTYYIGRTEVTNAQFRPFVEGDGYSNPDYWTDDGWQWRQENSREQPGFWDNPDWNGDDQPVVGISWYESMAYARWLSVQTGDDYRLPSEAEWEKAACGTDGRIYPWGDEPPDNTRANFGNVEERTVAVGSYPAGASPYGALDMAGNVWEWTRSEYRSYPYDPGDGREDSSNAAGKTFALRAGAWRHAQYNIRCANRGVPNPPLADNRTYGVRLARLSSP